jgi:hypothetical protein
MSIGGGGAIVVTEGSRAGLCRLVPARTRLEVRSDRRQWADSASCAAIIAWISTSWRYIMSSTSVVDEGKALRVLVVVALVWPSSCLAEGAAPLA